MDKSYYNMWRIRYGYFNKDRFKKKRTIEHRVKIFTGFITEIFSKYKRAPSAEASVGVCTGSW